MSSSRGELARAASRLLGSALLLAFACDEQPRAPTSSSAAPPSPTETWLRDGTSSWSLDFLHHSGQRGRYLFPEMGGSGGALLDANEDGRLDLFLLDGGHLDGSDAPAAPDRLFLQQPAGRFVDATERATVGDAGYGTGCAVGDVDNDGHLDLFVVNVGADALFCGRGDGTFVDATRARGLAEHAADGWGSSAAFLDYDADGWLDLYVAQYCDWKRGRACADFGGRLDYCNPNVYPPLGDTLWHNRGDGSFEDASDALGIRRIPRRGLGVAAADFDRDGWTDLFVANDGEENHLWINQRGRGFADRALLNGAAVNAAGRPEANMGIALGDVDGDGSLDLLVTHLRGESNTLYLGLGGGVFEDRTAASGLGPPSVPFTGFGVAFLDADHDGDLDCAVANGRVTRGPRLAGASRGPFWDDYAEPNLLFENERGRFVDAGAKGGAFTRDLAVSRALIPGDLDEDGDVDFVTTQIDGPARLFLNEASKRGHWLMVSARDPRLRRIAHGAEVVVVAGGRERVGCVAPATSYLASGDARVHFGLGEAERVEEIRVRWPGGDLERFECGDADRVVTVERGRGKPVR